MLGSSMTIDVHPISASYMVFSYWKELTRSTNPGSLEFERNGTVVGSFISLDDEPYSKSKEDCEQVEDVYAIVFRPDVEGD